MSAPTRLRQQIVSLLSKERAARRLGDDLHAEYLNSRIDELLDQIPRDIPTYRRQT